MKVAALDLGTNTFLCLIAEGDSRGIGKILLDEAEVVRLGQEVDKTGRFHDDALRRAKTCLTKFRRLIDGHQVDRVLCAATSAARDVSNGDELFKIAKDLNLPIEVIPGAEEARLSYAGACAGFQDGKYRLVVDIGGGSTELILGRGRELLFSKSLDIGAVRLTERHITRQPVPENEEKILTGAIQKILSPELQEISKNPVEEILAVAGTPTALAAAELGGYDRDKVDGYEFTLERLEKWCREFAGTTIEEKKAKYGLGGRADIIFAGISILRLVTQGLHQKRILVSTKGLRYGVALELLARS